ncbi:exopolyphosphatase [Pedobacter sp. KR3-3]|uniref:Exopolyphosphatase n=1 Tax=Pedobacter albus TaxID=3113905 RepID=A0ABU7I6N1_9SPHI|nr:exopolyphosphatase [Pedobacter sp. KR3-3]MEE1944951.1 exopolyphosphatase [Pedobacter sp. KR3-3]
MKIAVIDLGTNTFHLIIAEKNGSQTPQVVFKTNKPVKLGEDITKANLIIQAAFERGIACLKEFKAIADRFGVSQIKAMATSGVRSAHNGSEFVKEARIQAGINIEVIDGEQEATYIYEGVKWSGAITGKSLIMDIGGGSTEFILCSEEKVIWKKSYNIGAARLMQRFFKSDPINEHDKQAILTHLAEELEALKAICKEHKPQTLIGSAGAFETFAGMIDPMLDIDHVATANISLEAYQKLSHQLIKATHQERANMPRLIPLRVDMIVMASILTNYVLSELGIAQMKLSTYDLKMGVLASLSNQ